MSQNSQNSHETTTGNSCKNCGQPLQKKSKGGRPATFCSSNCRVAHWRKQRQAEKMQGGAESC